MEHIAYIVSIIAVLALGCDWRQTLWSTLWSSDLFEVNPLLGRQPSARRVNVYFFLSIIAVISPLTFFLFAEEFGAAIGLGGFVATVELCCVINNWSLGITLANMQRVSSRRKKLSDNNNRHS
jgi:hypothetical protein